MRGLAGLETCRGCALAAGRQRVVIGSGPERARLIVVGEAPGASEDAGGEPFVGRSGQLLFGLLGEVGLTREACYVTNVVKCRPPANRTPRAGEVRACSHWLDAQLEGLGPAPLLGLGLVAARRLFDTREGIASLRGRVLQAGARRGIVSYHPAAALRGGSRVREALAEDLGVLATLVAP